MKMTPALTAHVDQVTAGANDELDKLAELILAGDAEHGELLNLADYIGMLTLRFPPEQLAVYLILALRRLKEKT